jgi:hypothetical protein
LVGDRDVVPLKPQWQYQAVDGITYNVLPTHQIKPVLMQWLVREWQQDLSEAPGERWTEEWLSTLPRMEFTVEALPLSVIERRVDLMTEDEYLASLARRAAERMESFQRGVSAEPLVVDGSNMELMDGYARYTALEELGRRSVMAYVGRVRVV